MAPLDGEIKRPVSAVGHSILSLETSKHLISERSEDSGDHCASTTYGLGMDRNFGTVKFRVLDF
jgi:hypothetical protein